MNTPKQPELPDTDTAPPPATPASPHPLNRPDERKEGGPDHGRVRKQHEHHEKAEKDAKEQATDSERP